MTVTWQRLTLTGFGRFEGPVTIEFEPGLNVFVAPNERGKSTLLAGLAAVLFGLPAVSDETQFGSGKLRNWNDPLRFEGELQFCRGPAVYRVRRNFANHTVIVSVQTEEGWRDDVVGEHNPRARHRNVQYEQFLMDTVGIVHAELFWSVFAFGSPLPEAKEVDESIQRLLSGAGSGHYTGALEQLQKNGFRLTKYSKEMGIATRDRGNDGELEQLREQITQLEQQLASSREAVDEQQQLQLRLQELEETRKAAAEQRRRSEAALQAWTTWRDARSRHRRWLGEQSKLLQAWEQHNELAQEVARAQRHIREEFPEFDGGDDVGNKLESLREAEAQVATERARRRGDVAATLQRVPEKLDAWRSFVEERDELQQLDKVLNGKFAVFAEADEATRKEYSLYVMRRDKLVRRVAEAQRALERARAEGQRRVQQRSRFEKEYGDVAHLDDESASRAIADRLAALQQKDDLRAQRTALYEGKGAISVDWRAALLRPSSFVSLLIALALAVFVRDAPGWPGTYAVVVIGAAVWVVSVMAWERSRQKRLALRLLNEQLEQAEKQLAADTRLGAFADASAHELGLLQARLSARREAAVALALEGDAEIMADGGLDARAEREVHEAEEAFRVFTEQVRSAVERFGDDVAEAYSQWLSTRSERERLQATLVRWAEQRFGEASLQPEQTPLARIPAEGPGEIWLTLARIARTVLSAADEKETPVTVGDLLGVLATWTAEDRERIVDAVVEAEQAEQTEPIHQQHTAAELRAALQGVLAAAEGDVSRAQNRWQRYKQQQDRIGSVQSTQKGLLAGQGVASADELHVRALDAQGRAADARREMERLSAEHVDLPDAGEADDITGLEERLGRLQEAVAASRTAEEEVVEERRRVLEREASLRGASVTNIAGGEIELTVLRRREEQLQFEIETIGLAYRELVAAVEEYEQTHRDVLAAAADEYVQRFTGTQRRVVFDEQFHVRIQDPGGRLHAVAQLSQGARDQLYLALRLAVADLVAGEAPLPLLLDDPFVHCDEGRLARIREALDTLKAGRQVVLFSHRDDFDDWGHRITPHGEGWDPA